MNKEEAINILSHYANCLSGAKKGTVATEALIKALYKALDILKEPKLQNGGSSDA